MESPDNDNSRAVSPQGTLAGPAASRGEYRKALVRTAVAVLAAHVFLGLMTMGMVPWMGEDGGVGQASEWYTCYVIEESLSMDNLFAFYLVFRYFKVPVASQNRVLQWGIIGAVVMRLAMVTAGAAIVTRFHFVLLIFAAILVFQGTRIIWSDDDEDDFDGEDNWIVKLVGKVVPVLHEYDGSSFFVVGPGGRWMATPLMLVLIVIEISDVVFAVDSVPAAFGVSQSPTVIFTANMFAIMSLRSLYSIVAHAVNDLPALQKSIGAVLMFIGLKMFGESAGFSIPNSASMIVVFSLLGVGAFVSLRARKNSEGSLPGKLRWSDGMAMQL